MRIGKGSAKLEMLRHRQATDAGRKKHAAAQPLSVHVDRRRITLAGLRFMGEDPHPLQSFPPAGEDIE